MPYPRKPEFIIPSLTLLDGPTGHDTSRNYVRKGDFILRWGAKLGLFAESAEDHHPFVFTQPRFRVLAKHFGLKIETYQKFELGCNQLVVLKRRRG